MIATYFIKECNIWFCKTGKARKSICRSWVWYELLNGGKNTEVLPVPPLEVKDARLEEEGRLEHKAIMADRESRQNVKTIPGKSTASYLSTYIA